MAQRRWQFLLIFSVLVLALFLVGCPKKPATLTAAAPLPPAPTPAPAPPPAVTPVPPPRSVTPAPRAPEPPRAAAPAPAAPAPAAPTTPTTPTTPVPPPPPREFTAIDALKDIHFDFDKYDIRPGDAKILEENSKWMKSNPTHLILIEGHADERGTNEYNLALGERRAKSTTNHLVSLGIQAGRITIISYGEERPLCPEKNEDCWSQNRRAHFLVKPQ